MAVIEWTDVTGVAPELASVSDSAKALYLAFANAEFAPSVFGGEDAPKLKLARIYLAAHMATIASTSSNAGPVIAESEGRVSRSYANLSGSERWTGSSYGQELTRLIRTTRARLPRTF